ncbi:MAG: porin family protein [Bacteroidota bacterium]
MKKLSAILLVVLITIPAFSQLKFGIKAGVSTTNLSMAALKTITSGTTSYTVIALENAKYGFHGGLFMRLTLLGIYVQPELLLSTRTNEYTVKNIQTSASSVVKQNFNKLDIPVMVGFKLGPVRLNVGPAASILINTPKDLIDDSNFKSMYSRMTIGYQAGVGVDILKLLTVDLRYEGSLKKYQNQIEALTGGTKFNLDDRPNAFLLSLGLIF